MAHIVQRKRYTVWFVYFIGFLDLFGVSIFISFTTNIIINRGASPILAGIIGSSYGAMQIFSGPVMGSISDVYGRWPMLILSFIGPAFSYYIIAFSSSLAALIVSRLITGLFKHGQSISKAYLMDITPQDEQSSALGFFSACGSVGFIIGPIIGGHLAEWDATLRLSYLAAGSIFVLNAVLVTMVIPTRSTPMHSFPEQISFESIRSSFNFFSKVNWKRQFDLIMLRFVLSLSVMMFLKNFPLFVQDVYGIKYKSLGFIMSFRAVVSSTSSALAGRLFQIYSSQRAFLIHATFLLSSSLILASWSQSLSLTILCLVTLSIATSNLKIAIMKMMLSRGKDEDKGAIIGLSNSVSSISRVIAPNVLGILQEISTSTAGKASGLIAFSGVAITLTL